MSSEALAREISTAVSRSLSGEALDVAAKGEELAARYHELGMSGELIAKAIERTANLMRTMRTRAIKAPPAPGPGATIAAEDRGEESGGAGDELETAEVTGQGRTEYANGRAHYPANLAAEATNADRVASRKTHAATTASAWLSETPLAFLRRAFSRA